MKVNSWCLGAFGLVGFCFEPKYVRVHPMSHMKTAMGITKNTAVLFRLCINLFCV